MTPEEKKPTLTPEQWQAVSRLDRDLAVAAGAGSGKTWVLTNRYGAALNGKPLLETPAGQEGPKEVSPCQPREMVAITFTEKAAQEMKERIRSRLLEVLEEGTHPDLARWQALKEEVEGAAITTIHGFCARLLRENPLEGGVDPGFVIWQEGEALVALEEGVSAAIDRALLTGDIPGVAGLLQEYYRPRLEADLAGFYQTLREGRVDLEQLEAETLRALERRREKAWEAARSLVTLVPAVFDAVLKKKPTAQWEKRLQFLKEEWGVVEPFLLEWDGALSPEGAQVLELLGSSLSKLGKGTEEYKERIQVLLGILERNQVGEDYAAGAVAVCRLLQEIHRQFTARKKEMGVLEFTDLQTKALELLENNPPVARRYRQGIRHLLVDEFQDTNGVQKRLIEILAGREADIFPGQSKEGAPEKACLFVVGDGKQSIYRFRGADVEIFAALQEEMLREEGLVLSLNRNFRTQKDIIDFINYLFAGRIMRGPGGPEEKYKTPYEALVPHRRGAPVPLVETYFRFISPEEGEKYPSSLERRIHEARWIARRIRGLLQEEKVWEAGPQGEQPRRVRPGDVAILFSAMSDVALYEEALEEAGLPYYVVGGRNFYQKQEIWDLLNLLSYLEDEGDEISLAGVLRSPFFGLTDDGLYWLSRGGSLGRSLLALDPAEAWQGVSPEDRRILEKARRLLLRWRLLTRRLPLADALEQILKESGYLLVVLSQRGGKQKRANLLKVVEMARSLHSPVEDWVETLRFMVEREMAEGEAQVEGADSDVVKLMTIHQSKGLEFPVVFVPDLGRTLNNSSPPFLYSPETGVAWKSPGMSGEKEILAAGAGAYLELRERDKERSQEEQRRKLYVALTRARDLLILTGMEKASSKVREEEGNSWLQWLVYHLAEGVEEKLGEALGSLPVAVRIHPPWEEESIGNSPSLVPLWDQGEAGDLGGPDRYPLLKPVGERDKRTYYQYSVSTVMQYLACSRRFYYQTVVGLPEPGWEEPETERDLFHESDIPPDEREGGALPKATLLGTLFHQVCQLLSSPAEKEGIINRVLRSHGLAGERVVQTLRLWTDRYLQSQVYAWIRETREQGGRVFREWPFYLRVGDYTFGGAMDLVLVDGEGRIRVVDFKTNRLTEANLEGTVRDYELQLSFYAQAASRLLGGPVEGSYLYFVNGPDRDILRPVTCFPVEDKVTEVCRAIEAGRREEDFPRTPEEARCRYCPWGELCR